MVNKKAPFISFEGGEGSGKTTQIALLKDWLVAQGKDVQTTREPGGTEGGKAIRKLVVEGKDEDWDIRTETLLYMADRCQNVQTLIKPNIEKGVWVLTDRFVDSSYAYQSYGRGIPLEEIQSVYDFFAKGFMPDLTFYLDIDPQFGLERAAKGKGRNLAEMRFENIGLVFHQKLREGYLDLAKKNADRYVIITIDPDKKIEAIHEEIRRHVRERFAV